MKLKTSSSDAALFRKNLTRFAPVWMLYFIFLLLSFLLMHSWEGHRLAKNVSAAMAFMPAINAVYGLICAQLLFGDLFNARLCNGIHALPVSRTQLFRVNVLSGLTFGFLPALVVTLISLIPMIGYWNVAFLWLLSAWGSFLIFFLLASFCAVTTGSRFGMALLYGLMNTAAPMAYWLVDTIYMPLLPGLVLDWEVFGPWCPVYQLSADLALAPEWSRIDVTSAWEVIIRAEYFQYPVMLTVLSLGLGLGVLELYKRRHLESAGDLLAFRFLKPIFLTVYTLIIGACIFFFFEIFFYDSGQFYLYVGMVIGFFTGSMLLARSPWVFTKRNFALCAGFLVLVMSTVFLADWDPLGLTRWVPEAKDVEQVQLHIGGQVCYAEDQEDLEAILDAHAKAIDALDDGDSDEPQQWYNVDIYYTLSPGRQVHRRYTIERDSEAMAALKPLFTNPGFVLGDLYWNWDKMVIENIYNMYDEEWKERQFSQEDQDALLAALIADCEAGNMMKTWLRNYDSDMLYLGIYYRSTDPDTYGQTMVVELEIYPEAVNTVAWLEEHGFTGRTPDTE